MKSECHFINRSGWLRASVLGVNDGIISTSSLAIGVAAACVARDPIILVEEVGSQINQEMINDINELEDTN